MKNTSLLLLLFLVPGVASANVAASVNRTNGRISYALGNFSLKELAAHAKKECGSLALRTKDCAPVENRIGECSNPVGTGRRFGAFAAHNFADGWHATMACATSHDAAREMLEKICASCAMGDSFFDDAE